MTLSDFYAVLCAINVWVAASEHGGRAAFAWGVAALMALISIQYAIQRGPRA